MDHGPHGAGRRVDRHKGQEQDVVCVCGSRARWLVGESCVGRMRLWAGLGPGGWMAQQHGGGQARCTTGGRSWGGRGGAGVAGGVRVGPRGVGPVAFYGNFFIFENQLCRVPLG